jgi:hypothetical protein
MRNFEAFAERADMQYVRIIHSSKFNSTFIQTNTRKGFSIIFFQGK